MGPWLDHSIKSDLRGQASVGNTFWRSTWWVAQRGMTKKGKFDGLCKLSSRSIFCTYFSPFYPTLKPSLKPSFFYFTHSRPTNNKTKTQDVMVLAQRNKHRLHCTQDRFPQDDLTASSYCLVILGNTWTPTMAANAVQVFYSRLSLLIPLPEDESSSEVPLSGTIGGGVKISPT